MKSLKILSLALCLTIPMAHAIGDDSSCAGGIGLSLGLAFTTGIAAVRTIFDHYNPSNEDRKYPLMKPMAVAMVTALTIRCAHMTYDHCTTNK